MISLFLNLRGTTSWAAALAASFGWATALKCKLVKSIRSKSRLISVSLERPWQHEGMASPETRDSTIEANGDPLPLPRGLERVGKARDARVAAAGARGLHRRCL